MQQKIPIENLYYLLCYAWGVSDQLDKVKVDDEKCHSLENLLSMVLLNACDRLLRQGLLRAYRFEEQEVEGVRGKLNLAETLKSGKQLSAELPKWMWNRMSAWNVCRSSARQSSSRFMLPVCTKVKRLPYWAIILRWATGTSIISCR